MSDWDESKVRRDWHGRFTHDLIGKWAVEASQRFNDRGLRRGDSRPPGFDAAVARTQHLWNVPDRDGTERTDAEQAELEELEEAFGAYRKVLDLEPGQRWSRELGGYGFKDSMDRRYDQYGRFVDGFPLSGRGRLESQSLKAKRRTRSRRYENWTSTPKGRERQHAADGGKIGRRLEDAPEAFVKDMRRAQARTRAETGRVGKRRTPRGTLVEGWMSKVNDKIEKGARRG